MWTNAPSPSAQRRPPSPPGRASSDAGAPFGSTAQRALRAVRASAAPTKRGDQTQPTAAHSLDADARTPQEGSASSWTQKPTQRRQDGRRTAPRAQSTAVTTAILETCSASESRSANGAKGNHDARHEQSARLYVLALLKRFLCESRERGASIWRPTTSPSGPVKSAASDSGEPVEHAAAPALVVGVFGESSAHFASRSTSPTSAKKSSADADWATRTRSCCPACFGRPLRSCVDADGIPSSCLSRSLTIP